MNTPVKVALYIVLTIGTIIFGKYFFRDYERSDNTSATIGLSDDPMDIDLPSYQPGGVIGNESPNEDANAAAPEIEAVPGNESETASTPGESLAEELDDTTSTASTTTAEANEEALPPPRLGFYGGGFCLFLLGLGLMAAFDISQLAGRTAADALFNEDGVGTTDDEYEAAEAEWQKGDFLEAIRLMREYLAANPKQIHAALRIAEIYEKDLSNPLAAALEYEEILNKNLPRERWGWAAIHLANLYSGPLEKPDQAIALLRRLDEEYGETQAAEKARRRLEMIDGASPEGDA